MKIEQVITQRFAELEEKAHRVAATRKRTPGPYTYEGVDTGELRGWVTNVLSLLQRVFGENSVHYRNFNDLYLAFDWSTEHYKNFLAVFLAAKEDYESGYLFSVRGYIKAEDGMDILEQANELLACGHKDLACILAGVSLEIAIKELCTRSEIPHSKLDSMNVELCKTRTYNMGMQKQIGAWAHWRNKAAHGQWEEYVEADVDAMIKGVTRFIADHL